MTFVDPLAGRRDLTRQTGKPVSFSGRGRRESELATCMQQCCVAKSEGTDPELTRLTSADSTKAAAVFHSWQLVSERKSYRRTISVFPVRENDFVSKD